MAQLERDLIAERVRNGLANAKAKGIRIGRLKTRDSDLIRKLRASGMTFRDIAKIAKCSTGAVGAEMRAMKAEAKKKEINVVLDNPTVVEKLPTSDVHLGQVFDLNISDLHLELAE